MDSVRLKKIRFRAWHRGFREADLILGPFADSHVESLTPELVDDFERLLEQPDHDIYEWIVGRARPPGDFAELVLLLQAFKPSRRGGDHGA